jgi:arylsulfatase A-like enzyme
MTTAVRTTDAKLIKYPGHDEWTEVFDLKADPYELKNLAADPAYADLRKQLEAEYAKLAKAIDFKVPDFADKPAAEGAEGAKPKAGKKKKAK